MENSKGDQPPEKNLIGPSLPVSESVLFDGQPECPRSAQGNREFFSTLSNDLGSTAGRARHNADLGRDLEAQLRDCFNGPALHSDFCEDPASFNDSFSRELGAFGIERSEVSCSHLATMEDPCPQPTVLLETTPLGSPSPQPVATPGDWTAETAPSLHDVIPPQMFTEVLQSNSGGYYTYEQLLTFIPTNSYHDESTTAAPQAPYTHSTTAASQAPDTTTTLLCASPVASQPSNPQSIIIRDADQIHIQVSATAVAGVKEPVVIETEEKGDCHSLIAMEPQSSCSLLAAEKPAKVAAVKEEGGERQKEESTGCCFFLCCRNTK